MFRLFSGNFKFATFEFDCNQTINVQRKKGYRVFYENESDDIVIVKIVWEGYYKPKPLALMGKDVVRDPEEDENHHPEGWPLCMHGVGFPSGKLYINERMKILHKKEMKRMAQEMMGWFQTTSEAESQYQKLKPIAEMLQNAADKCNNDTEKFRVYYKFLFPSEDDVYFVGDLEHGASGCPCLVFDKHNDTVIQVVLLGACPQQIFNKDGAKKEFPARFIVRRGLSTSRLYKRLTEARFHFAENSKSCTWMLRAPPRPNWVYVTHL